MAQEVFQQVQNKGTAYATEGALVIWGVTLTQWATIIGIGVALFGAVLAYLTYRSNKWKNEELVREDREHKDQIEQIEREKGE